MELLIASTMMAVLFVGVGMHLRGGLRVWKRATETTDALQRMRVGLDQLERDLANAIIYDTDSDHYRDDRDDTLDDHRVPKPQLTAEHAQWFTVIRTARPDVAPSVRIVRYERFQGNGAPPMLKRSSRSIGAARAHQAPQEQTVLPKCTELSFRYGYAPANQAEPVEWKSAWQPDPPISELPRLVEITGVAFGRPFRRVVLIPIGVFKPFTAATTTP